MQFFLTINFPHYVPFNRTIIQHIVSYLRVQIPPPLPCLSLLITVYPWGKTQFDSIFMVIDISFLMILGLIFPIWFLNSSFLHLPLCAFIYTIFFLFSPTTWYTWPLSACNKGDVSWSIISVVSYISLTWFSSFVTLILMVQFVATIPASCSLDKRISTDYVSSHS